MCIHVYGLGVYLPEHGTFGHVNTTVMGVESMHSLDDYPSVGSRLSLRILGYSGTQLRLRVEPQPSH